jgi:oligopeptide/dipeptide ABC transporter ATP-binding protein
LLEVRELVTRFETDRGSLDAVAGVSFDLRAGGTLGVVGESGCGKSVMSLSIMGLLPTPPGRIVAGELMFEGRDLRRLPAAELRALRGSAISMIFQEPMTSLNPVYTCGQQIMESVQLHQKLSRAQARARAIELLELVGIPAPDRRVDSYPHELSGGMRQRVMIAIAIACGPRLLIADEPTTALDVTIQAQILELLAKLQRELSMGIILITHDLGVVAEFVDEVIVMYAGKVVERASTPELFAHPRHPYTRGLLSSVPGLREPIVAGARKRLPTIEGMVPDLMHLPSGCRFRSRCPLAMPLCAEREPVLERVGASQVACFAAGADAAEPGA